ncbi:MAG: exodeoxyribonuclease VII small subunit [Bacteroidetes bacterium]|jgi:exodeoxyribonuclease VII small subunit|nr:MAG: exodeoxyribonuclease VII small subunit [Bacteroidota bacterium]|tara:strand:+ start:210 stop:410 length:201 start_codon:yes stop_codon:yes gene_type:complete
MSKTKISYDASFEELQEIMQDLQEDEISVDELTAKVKRAAELLKMCNQILRDTEKNVGDLIKDLGL